MPLQTRGALNLNGEPYTGDGGEGKPYLNDMVKDYHVISPCELTRRTQPPSVTITRPFEGV